MNLLARQVPPEPGSVASGTVYCVTPVFNRINATLACIDCLKSQTYSDLVIIVVDGGSTDGTPEIIAKQHPDVIVIRGDKDLWWGEATRVGIDWALARSASDDDLIMLVNNDTTFGDDYVGKLIRYSLAHGAAMPV